MDHGESRPGIEVGESDHPDGSCAHSPNREHPRLITSSAIPLIDDLDALTAGPRGALAIGQPSGEARASRRGAAPPCVLRSLRRLRPF